MRRRPPHHAALPRVRARLPAPPPAPLRAIRAVIVRAGILAACALLALGPARAASLTGEVDHSFMSVRETFNYVLSLADGDSREPPDVSALTRDFDIVDRARRSRVDGRSGQPVEVNEWVLTLAPKRTGILTVPSLTLDGLTTKPLTVEVVPALPVDQPDDAPLFVRVDVGDVSPYAQSLIPVVIRIFDSLGLRQGRLSQPTADGAGLTEEGKQRTYVRTVGHKRYGVIEQSFLMQPQRSGTVTMEPVTVTASVPGRGNPAASALPNLMGHSALSPLNYEDVTIRSRPVEVEVKPRPAGVTGWFLPAQDVRLSQDWSPAPDTAQVGVVLTRTIRLAARGASPNQLPPLPIVEVAGVRQYEDDSRSERAAMDGAMGAVLEKTISVVPTRPGAVTLPPLAVSWWNTDTGQAERAELPAVTLNVAPALGAGPAPLSAAVPAGAANAALGPQVPTDGLIEKLLGALARHLWQVGAGIGVAAVLAVALMKWRKARRRARARTAPPTAAARWSPSPPKRRAQARTIDFPTAAAAEKALARACRANDAESAHGAFLAWLRLSADAGGLHTPKMAPAIQDLSAALYASVPTPWRGRDFLSAFHAEKRARRKVARGTRRPRIAPLYPTG